MSSVLEDPAALVPAADPGRDGEFARFRAACSRFVNGPEHARRREFLQQRLAYLDHTELRAVAATLTDDSPEFLPVAVLATALGFREPHRLPELVAPLAAAYPTGEGNPEEATREALRRAPRDNPELHLQLLVQAFAATAALARGVDPPVPTTRRLVAGESVVVELDECPFGAGPRRCPAQDVAELLAGLARP